MSLIRWDPFREMVSLREAMDRLLSESITPARPRDGDAMTFPVDVYEEGNDIIVEADLPGLKPEEVDIQVQGDHLMINAQRQREEEKRDRQFYRRERIVQRFVRMVPLPTDVNAQQAEATYQDGHLRIRLPKSEEARTRRIEVKGQSSAQGGETGQGEQPAQQPAEQEVAYQQS